jgi:hypothetical protein
MAIKALPSRALVHQLLRYDAKTGDLIWLQRPRELFASNGAFVNWNDRYPGRVAGYPRPQHEPRRGHYLVIGINGMIYKAHRLVWLYVHGEPVPDRIDHRDLDQLNNRIDNLRAATHSQNKANGRVRIDNKLGLKGVGLSRHGTFRVIVGGNYLGSFRTVEEAIRTHKEASARLFGEFARWDER